MTGPKGHRPATVTNLLAHVEARMGAVADAAEGAAGAVADLVLADAVASHRCLDPRCFRRGKAGHCEYHDPENRIEHVIVGAQTTRRYLRSLAYAEGVTADAAALDHEVPRIAGQILVDRADLIATDGDSGLIGSLLQLNRRPPVQTCLIAVALPAPARETYARAAAAVDLTIVQLIAIYLDQIALDVWEVREIAS